MAEIDVRITAPDESRSAADTMRAALLTGPASDEDWERAAAGWGQDHLSISAWDGTRCVGHAGAFRLDTIVPGGARLGTAAVTRIGILPTHTRQGLLTRMLTRLLRDARDEGRPFASLRASEAVIYGRFGFGVAGESTSVTVDSRRARPIRNAAPGSFRILTRGELLAVLPPLYDRVATRTGVISRTMFLWDRYLEDALRGDKGSHVVVHTAVDGTDDGFAHYAVKWNEISFTEAVGIGEVHDLWGATPEVELALWDYLTGIDLVRSYKVDERPPDDVLRWAANDRRCVAVKDRFDEQWVRLLDVEVALAARTYRPSAEVVTIAVTDPLFEDNSDTFEVSATGVRRLGRGTAADLEAEIGTVSAAYMGSTSWAVLAAAGRVDGSAEAVARADDLFTHRPGAWCGSFF
jgi:predicted acetyltransferase